MKRKCAYCGFDKVLTKEHIWPKCIIKRTPEHDLRFLDSKKIVTGSELVITDVCEECNNNLLAPLDAYLCLLYDQYFISYKEEKIPFIFEYNYELLLRAILKITYNSSRTVTRLNNEFEKFKSFILYGRENREDILIKLDIVTPTLQNEKKIYPTSTRCAKVKVDGKNEHFTIRLISINSFYFYIIISNALYLTDELIDDEYLKICDCIPGTIIHPYRESTLINQFSTEDTYSIHHDHLTLNNQHYQRYIDNQKNKLQ